MTLATNATNVATATATATVTANLAEAFLPSPSLVRRRRGGRRGDGGGRRGGRRRRRLTKLGEGRKAMGGERS